MSLINQNAGQVHTCSDARSGDLRCLISLLNDAGTKSDLVRLGNLQKIPVKHQDLLTTKLHGVLIAVYLLQSDLLQWAKAELGRES